MTWFGRECSENFLKVCRVQSDRTMPYLSPETSHLSWLVPGQGRPSFKAEALKADVEAATPYGVSPKCNGIHTVTRKTGPRRKFVCSAQLRAFPSATLTQPFITRGNMKAALYSSLGVASERQFVLDILESPLRPGFIFPLSAPRA